MTDLRKDREVFIGALILAILGVVTVGGTIIVLGGFVGGPSTHEVRAIFGDAKQFEPGDDIRVDGVKSGKIARIIGNEDAGTATVVMNVADEAGTIYDNARAVMRFKTLLGGSFYVDLERGSANRPPLGDKTIPLAQTARQVEVDDVTAAFGGGAVDGLRILPGELADALRDPEAPAQLLDTIADVSPGVDKGLHALRGTDLDTDLEGLVVNTAATVKALDTPTDDLTALISGGAATVATTARRQDDIRSLLRQAPPTEAVVNRTLDRLRTTLDLADPLVAKLQAPAVEVAPTLRLLRPVLVDASSLLQRAVPLLRALRPAATSLAGAARRGLPMVNELTPSIRRLRKNILPMLSEVDPQTTKSTAVMIGGTFTGLASGAGGQIDGNGHFIRFPATIGSSPVNSLPCQIYLLNPDAAELAACEDLQGAFAKYLNYVPVGDPPGSEPARRKGTR